MKFTENIALIHLVQKNLESYGPATEKDISWWTGLTLASIQTTIKKIKTPLEKVNISNLNSTYLISSSDLNSFNNLMQTPKISNFDNFTQ